MFASMIFKKEPFFHGHDNYDQVCVYLPVVISFLKELYFVFNLCRRMWLLATVVFLSL